MFNALSAKVGALFNRQGAGFTVPILDGAYRPNNLIEQAAIYGEHAELEDITLGPGGELYAACGTSVMQVSESGDFTPVATFDHVVTALAYMPAGTLAVAFGTNVIVAPGTANQKIIDSADGKPFVAVNALQANMDGSLLICDGSETCPYGEWSRDLLEKGKTGRLVRYDHVSGKTATMAPGLAYAFGAHVDTQNRVLVSESWRHQVSAVNEGRTTPAIVGLPGYPSRMAPAEGGGFWLSLFATRTLLMEFILRETDYRQEMMRTMEPEYWVAPALSSGKDFREPLQGGGVKQMGILKPWAPPRSYGLVVRYDADLMPLFSLHSRAGGENHGIVAIVERGDDLFLASKGSGRLLRLSLSEIKAAKALEAGI